MKIQFEITNIPNSKQSKYPCAYLEGILEIHINNILFFNQSGILLIEFAIFINRWLKRIKKEKLDDFNFETMDYDEPILTLNYVEKNFYRIFSIWQEIEIPALLAKDEIIAAFDKYLSDLKIELKIILGIELENILNEIE